MGLTPSCDTQGVFYISNAENIQELPDVCYGSGSYVVVWTDFRNGIDRLIMTARVTPQWAVLDTGNIVCSNAAYQITPMIAFDGTRFLVVWQNLASPFGIYCRFLGDDAMPQDSVLTVSSSVMAANPRIVFGGSRYLIVWQEFSTTNDIIGQFVSPSGGFIGDPFTITSGPQSHVSPGLCYDGSCFLVVWSQNAIYGQFVSETGNLVGGAFPISASANGQVDPDAFFGNGKYLVTWSEFQTDYDIYGNIDVQVGVQESDRYILTDREVYPAKTLFLDKLDIIGGGNRPVSVFDISGRRVAEIRDGVWEAHRAPPGVYFLSVESGRVFKVIKVE